MLKNIKKLNQGFTIIEVLIVLAIAGLILLIVFLAVPNLQRNSRNTQLRNGVSSVLGAVNEFVSNNGGQLPNSVSGTGTVTISNTAITGSTPSTVKISGGLTAATSGTADIVINLGKKCSGTTVGTGTARNVAATFSIETSGNPAPQCTDG